MDSVAMIRPDMLENVLGAIDLGAVVLDAERRVVLWNRWMAQHSGHPQAAVLGRDFLAVFPDLKGKRLDNAVQQALRDNFPAVLSQTLHKAPMPLFADRTARAKGVRMQQAVAVTPLEVGGATRHCLIQVSDVSAAVHRERLLRDQALELRSQTFSDGLTGIANRRHFDLSMEKEQRRAKRTGISLTMLMIDIDFFKAYNDHYGHQQGDDTLIRVANALAGSLQRPLDLIARYGGEEFAVVLPDMDSAGGARVAENLRQRIAQLAIPHAAASASRFVTVSIGVATQAPHNPVEVAQLIGAADRALYAAKRCGRDRVVIENP
ncbi:MAG: diguanylate cyclase [Pseudomonadota bacterium]